MKLKTLFALVIVLCVPAFADESMDRILKAANERSRLAIVACGNGHQATIVMGKVTECDGKPIGAAPKVIHEDSSFKWSLECYATGKNILCQDGFYQEVNPIVAKALFNSKN